MLKSHDVAAARGPNFGTAGGVHRTLQLLLTEKNKNYVLQHVSFNGRTRPSLLGRYAGSNPVTCTKWKSNGDPRVNNDRGKRASSRDSENVVEKYLGGTRGPDRRVHLVVYRTKCKNYQCS